LFGGAAVVGTLGCSGPAGEATGSTSAPLQAGLVTVPDSEGLFADYSTTGGIDLRNEFFQNLGTNGRTCGTCHRIENGFSLSTNVANIIFDLTGGKDPLFAPIDGANSPNADVSTVQARRQASSLLLNRGVFRIGLPMPANAQFTLINIQDPYGYATPNALSLYRRPLMASNLPFVEGTMIMWDGREPNLASQANDANMVHAQTTTPLTATQQQDIVNFETALFTAQTYTLGIGDLTEVGGGPVALSTQPFSIGENGRQAPAFPVTQNVFSLYSQFTNSNNPNQQAVLRGQEIFNNRTLHFLVPGNPNTAVTCSFCHTTFNVGGNDVAFPGRSFGIGTSGGVAAGSPGGLSEQVVSQFLAPDLPVYTFQNNATGATVQVNDPGVALIDGQWIHIGFFKSPNLRGLLSHAPYFHNGLAKTLLDVVNFYDTVIATPGGLPMSDQEKSDLVSFLSTL